MGNLTCSEQKLKRAISDSQLTLFFKNSNHRLDSVVSEKGSSLSGGEKQRIAICRGLLRANQAGTYMLDEATSNR